MTVLFLFFTLLLNARPPQDLILDPPQRPGGTRIIRDKNVTFTSTHPDKEEEVAVAIRIKVAVKGRSRPYRNGNVLSQLKAGSIVEPFRWSGDKKWVGVKVKQSGLRVWVPVSSLPPLDEKFKLIKKAQSKSSASSAVSEDSEVE